MTAALVRLDWWSVRPYRSQLVLLLGIATVMGVLGQPAVVLPIGAVYALLAAGYPFAVAEKNDLDTLLGTLPVSRRDVVVGRYVWALGLGVAALLAGLAITGLVLSMGDTPMAGADVVGVAAVAFALYGLGVAFQYPIYLALGYLRSRLVALLPLMVVAALVAVVGPRLGLEGRGQVPGWAAPALACGTVVLLGVSLAVAVRVDARRTR